MKILCIEDTDFKFNDIEKNLKEFFLSKDIDINIQREISVKSGTMTLMNSHYDLLILDMQMPFYSDPEESWDIQLDGGCQVMDNIEFYENISKPYIIVVSANSNIKEQISNYKVPAITYDYGMDWDKEFKKELEVFNNGK